MSKPQPYSQHTTQSWVIPGAASLPLYGDTHIPHNPPCAVAIILHGFLGYKDYGLIVKLAQLLARCNVIAHRFNFAHSGVTPHATIFDRPDLFSDQTWNAQVQDVQHVCGAIKRGQLLGDGLPLFVLGHSRGGVAALLFANRHHHTHSLTGIVTLAAPSACCTMSTHEQNEFIARGYTLVHSNRTGQDLRINSRWLEEQIIDPGAHDLRKALASIPCPILVIHGLADQTVAPCAAHELASWAPRTQLVLVPDANHVFNVPNPPNPEASESGEFHILASSIERFVGEMADNSCRS